MELLIGLDVGTSAVKGVLLSSSGEILWQLRRPTELLRPQPGFVELVPEDHYLSVAGLIKELASKAPAGSRIAAVSMAAASGNTLLLDEESMPLTNIISWLDQRGTGKDKIILPGLDFDTIHRTVGWGWYGSFPLAHLGWLKKYAPETYAKTSRFAMNNDYLYYRLTGEWGLDPSTATTFYLQDQVKRQWHKPYLEMLRIRENQLSRIMPSGAVLGPVTSQAASDTGLSTDTLVVLGAFDHPCAARGTGTLAEGDLLLSCGTSWVGFYPTFDRGLGLKAQLLVDPFLYPEGPWGVMYSLPGIGVTIDWYIDTFFSPQGTPDNDKYVLFNREAQKSSIGADGLTINPFKNIQISIREVETLRSNYSAASIGRAVMEGTAFEMRKKLEELSRAGLRAERIAMVGGPSESPVWPSILSTVTGLTLKLINGQTAGAVGAAILAGIGAKIFKNEAEASSTLGGNERIVSPTVSEIRAYNALYERYLDL
ncbi:MAG: FGGY family carbohydrate kinase [Spirochaetota bacterium]